MKKLLLSSLVVLLYMPFMVAQNNIDLNSLPDVEDYTVVRTNPSADTVIIGLHGGPTDMLYEGDFEFFETISTFSVVEMGQYQHLNPAFVANPDVTLEEAIIANDTTVALLRKLVNHYNAMDKTVVLIGHSFGAFLLPEYLDDYGIEEVHRVIPMAGRLNMNEEVVEAFATGYFAEFSDGVTVVVDSEQAPEEFHAAMKLQAGVGANRFVDSLGMMDLSKLMYVYGTLDQAVGTLLPEEIDMLENTNASIVVAQGGGHDSPFFDPQMIQILNFIRGDQMVGIFENNLAKAEVSMYPAIVEEALTIKAQKNGTLRISNINGQLITQSEIAAGDHQIEMGQLPAGFYIATYQTFDNEWASQKLMVK